MENANGSFALSMIGGTHSKEEHEAAMREYEHRKANADKIEAALMTACTVVADRLEQNAQSMSNTEIAQAIGTLAGISTTLGALLLYSTKPYSYSCD